MIELVSILKRCGPEGQELVKKLDKGVFQKGGSQSRAMPMTLQSGMKESGVKLREATRSGKIKGPDGISGYEELEC